MKDHFKKEQGKRLKLARKAFSKKLTQKRIATAMGIPLRTYQSYEIGEANPEDTLLVKIANFLAVKPDQIKYGPGRGRNLSAEIRELLRERDEIESKRDNR
ncbi:MAG: XRE family transcriptional regulator [Deltaproteobacteria bacterium]|nr:MAG: XRE family transcriptional regulator [Deltaproteobacteria bacterium]